MNRCLGCMKLYADTYQICPHCGYIKDTKADEAFHMAPGTILLKRYIIGKVVGFGGFGVTYVAWDEVLEKRVAIKEYLPSEFSTRVQGQSKVTVFGDEKEEQFNIGVKKFIEEARKLMRFKSVPGIVQFFNCFEENGTAYIVMEYLEGETLKERLDREKTLPVDDALNIIMPIIESLEIIHKDGIIHRDISPDNIFLTADKKVKLIDFGASRFATTTYSKSVSILIKEGYAPEEQYGGRNQGTWTDVYALAATFYKSVTGIIPQVSMERKIKDKVKVPSKLGVDIPKNIENAIMNAMNIKVEDRTQNFADLKSEILDTNTKRNFIKQRRADIGKWPLWAKITSGVAGVAIAISILLVATGVIRFNFVDSIASMLGNNEVEVPAVIAMTREEAEEKLSEAGLVTQYLEYIESEEIPAECVYSQSPGINERVKKGDTVSLILSCGVENKKMINAVGYDSEQIIEMLKNMGVSVKVVDVQSNGAKGTVIEQKLGDKALTEGTEVKEGMVVTICVSSGNNVTGSSNVKVPDFSNKSYEEALKLAEESNIYIKIIDDENSEKIKKDQILKQSVATGSIVKAGTTVELTRSKGDTVVVPNFLLKTKDEAEAMAKEAGIKYKFTYANSKTVPKNKVISQSVEKDSSIKFTKVIEIKISKGNDKAEEHTTKKQTTTEYQTTWQQTTTQQKTTTQQTTTEQKTTTQQTTTEQQTTTGQQTTEQQTTTEKIPTAPIGWTTDSSLVNSKYYTYETKTQYLVRNRTVTEEKTTSSSSTLSGWELYNTISYWNDYGAWSDWSTNVVYASDSRQVETRTIPATYKTQYNYSRYCSGANGVGNTGPWAGYWSGVYCGYYFERGWSDSPLPITGTESGFNLYGSPYPWYNETIRQVVVTNAYTQYRYRDRTCGYLYYFKRNVYGAWDAGTWSDTQPAQTDTCKVDSTRTLYRYTRK